MDGPRDDHTKWSKSEIEGQIPYDITYVWNLKKWYTVILFTVSFIVHNFFSLMWFHWFVFVSLVFGVSLTKTLLRLMLLRLPPVFSSWNYMCFTLRLTSLIYFELIVVHGVKCLSWNTVLSERGRVVEMKLLENSDKKKNHTVEEEWQTTSVFLPGEPHEQYEKAKRAWCVAIHWVTKSWTQFSNWMTTTA